MILIINTKVTDVRHLNYRKEENAEYPNNNRMDVFKYCLASYSSFVPLLTKCLFYIEVSGEFINRREELENFIYELFPKEILELHWYRNNYKNDWLNVCEVVEKIEDDIIWLAGNDDHIFIDSSLDVLKDGIDIIKNDENPMSIFTVSHYPELVKLAVSLGGDLQENGNFVKVRWQNTDSLHVIKKGRFFKYWRDICPPNSLNFRPDSICDYNNPLCHNNSLISDVYISTKELVRHFDGYNHVSKLNNLTPPLFIPPGFFEKKIRIKYGFTSRDSECTNLNPLFENLLAYSPNGIDYKWCLEDIPIFWKNRLTSVEFGPSDIHEMKKARNKFVSSIAKNNITTCFGRDTNNTIVPDVWLEKNMLK